ncbi:hypothetical protein BDR06DRAFT_741261 [Suillus hirtellus]|nr:hypothetical protein BDR06DRAFT_741261 [Suillus hirtellus]
MFMGPAKNLIAVVCVVNKTLFMNLRAWVVMVFTPNLLDELRRLFLSVVQESKEDNLTGLTLRVLGGISVFCEDLYCLICGGCRFGAGGIPRHPPQPFLRYSRRTPHLIFYSILVPPQRRHNSRTFNQTSVSSANHCHRQSEALFNRGYVPDAIIDGIFSDAHPISTHMVRPFRLSMTYNCM